MTQLDLILETHVRAAPERVACKVRAPGFAREMWPLWNIEVSEDRGSLGVRWVLVDRRFAGSTEVWIEAVPQGCVLHAFARVDRRGRGRIRGWRARRVRAVMTAVLWRVKDDVEGGGARRSG